MSWLSKIEKNNKKMRETADRLLPTETPKDEIPKERMARVIRELARYIRASHAVEEACLEFNPVDFDKIEKEREDAWDNLSPDAKEVVEETINDC